jgi:NTE family protein
MHTIDEINDAVNRIYYSGYFEKVYYGLSRNAEGYTLTINVDEKQSNLFRAGGHYDSYTEASLLLNVRLQNFLIDGSKTNMSFILGPNPAIDLTYSIDQGHKLGYAVRANYRTKELFAYDDLFKSTTSSYFFSFTSAELMTYSNYSSNRRFMLGAKFDYFSLKSNVSVVPDFDISTPIFNVYAAYKIDSYDDANYPTDGSRLLIKANQAISENKHPMTFMKLDYETTFASAGKKLFFMPGIFVGASFGDPSPYPYKFVLGGMGQNYIENMVPFAGMRYTSYFEDNTIIARLKIRWNFLGKHNIFVIGNAGTFNDIFESMFSDSKLYYGGAIGYSLQSLIGPIELSWAASNQGPYGTGFLNIGYWF